MLVLNRDPLTKILFVVVFLCFFFVLCLRKKSFFGYFRTVLELSASFCDHGPSAKQRAAPAGFVEGCWLFFIVVSKFPLNYVGCVAYTYSTSHYFLFTIAIWTLYKIAFLNEEEINLCMIFRIPSFLAELQRIENNEMWNKCTRHNPHR